MKRRLQIEALESRALMSTISLTRTGTLSLVGDEHKQDAIVWIENGEVHASMTNSWFKQINNGGDLLPFTTFTTKVVPLASVNRIAFSGLDGSDSFTNDTSIPCVAYGGTGTDFLIGGSGADSLYGGSGSDYLEGREGMSHSSKDGPTSQ